MIAKGIKTLQCVLKVPRLPNNVLKKFKNDNSNLDFKESQDCIGISQNNTSRKKPEIMQKGKKGLTPNIDELSRNKQPVKKKLQQSENEEHLQSKIIKINMGKQDVAKEPQKIQSIDGKLHSNIDYSATVKDGRCIFKVQQGIFWENKKILY